jgi:hypothetical protein
VVLRLRRPLTPAIRKLQVKGISNGSQPLISSIFSV